MLHKMSYVKYDKNGQIVEYWRFVSNKWEQYLIDSYKDDSNRYKLIYCPVRKKAYWTNNYYGSVFLLPTENVGVMPSEGEAKEVWKQFFDHLMKINPMILERDLHIEFRQKPASLIKKLS